MLTVIVWFVISWVGGIAAILGSLMTIASFLLWLAPADLQNWQNRLKLTGFSLLCTIVGFTLLVLFPFPS